MATQHCVYTEEKHLMVDLLLLGPGIPGKLLSYLNTVLHFFTGHLTEIKSHNSSLDESLY